MSVKLRNTAIYILTAVLAACLITVSFTYGRYELETGSGSDIHGKISYNVSNKLEVNSVEELLIAIENGYSYVKVSDDVENPLVVTSAIVNVGSDLIIDLNGHDLQRNNRDAILNVAPDVSVTVIDSSKKQSGSLYNPVGNVLKVGGGTLTVAAGKFESGPRASEYLSYNPQPNEFPVHGNVSQTLSCKLYEKANGGYEEAQTAVSVPVINPVTAESETEGKYYVNGNLYIDTVTGLSGVDGVFGKDTFLYYSIDDGAAFPNKIYSVGSSDFYYTYYTKKTVENGKPSYGGVATEEDIESGNAVAVTVYGYKGVMALAKNATSDFAAIKMQAGSLQVSGGSYFSHFGVSTAYCVFASGGKMSIERGDFYAVNEGVCIRCAYTGSGTLHINDGSFKSHRGDTIQMTSGTMTVKGGTFSKDSSAFTEGITAANHNNSAINVEGQNTAIILQSSPESPVNFYLAGRFMAAIRCSGGAQIKSTGVNYQFGTTNGRDEVKGGNNMGIFSKGGHVTVEDCVFIQPGEYSYGIYSQETETANKDNAEVTVRSSVFSLRGERSTGIYADGGTVNIGTRDDMLNPATETLTVDGKQTDGLAIESYTMFYLDHVANCYGIYAAGKDETEMHINVYSGQFIVGSGHAADGSHYSDEKPDDITAKELEANNEVWGAGIYLNMQKGEVKLGSVRIVAGGDYGAGIYAEKGTISSLYTPANDKGATPPTTVVFVGTRINGYINGGQQDAAADKKSDRWFYLYKTADDYVQTDDFETHYDRIENCNDSKCEFGIVSKGGSINLGRVYINLRSKKSAGIYARGDVTLDWFHADIDDESIGNENQAQYAYGYLSTSIMSVEGGNVTLGDCRTATDGIGYTIEDGTLNIKGNAVIASANATAFVLRSGAGHAQSNVTIEKDAEVTVTCNITGSEKDSGTNRSEPYFWQLPYQTEVQKNRHYDGIEVNSGSFNVTGALTVTNTGLENDSDYATNNATIARYANFTVKSYAVRVKDGSFTATGKLHVTADVGGGVYAAGNVTLGTENGDNDISVTATGNKISGTYYPVSIVNESGWEAPVNLTGGNALQITGGNMTVYGGKYVAQLGNGVRLTGSSDDTDKSNFTSYGGTFKGYMNAEGAYFDGKSGPGAFYGLKVLGGSVVNIYGGTFGGGNGGVFMTGVTTVTGNGYYGYNTSGGVAEAYIYAGEFGDTQGLDGFNVYDNCKVIFGAYRAGAAPDKFDYKTGIKVVSKKASVAVNPLLFNKGYMQASSVEVYYGSYQGGEYGVYLDGNCIGATVTVYNASGSEYYPSYITDYIVFAKNIENPQTTGEMRVTKVYINDGSAPQLRQ